MKTKERNVLEEKKLEKTEECNYNFLDNNEENSGILVFVLVIVAGFIIFPENFLMNLPIIVLIGFIAVMLYGIFE